MNINIIIGYILATHVSLMNSCISLVSFVNSNVFMQHWLFYFLYYFRVQISYMKSTEFYLFYYHANHGILGANPPSLAPPALNERSVHCRTAGTITPLWVCIELQYKICEVWLIDSQITFASWIMIYEKPTASNMPAVLVEVDGMMVMWHNCYSGTVDCGIL